VNLFRGCGAFADYCIATAAAAVPLPASLSFDAAAAVPCAGWTAFKALAVKMAVDRCPGGSIVVTGGNGARHVCVNNCRAAVDMLTFCVCGVSASV
jgi:NADPH:quinone reductase-like Zn-dependent oxidoreductase